MAESPCTYEHYFSDGSQPHSQEIDVNTIGEDDITDMEHAKAKNFLQMKN
jgi:hypothetical protein